MEFSFTNPDRPDVIRLLQASDNYMADLYPNDSNHLLDLNSLCKPHVRFLVAAEAGIAMGCGALVRHDGWAELKRMWVEPQLRGQGIGADILRCLMLDARVSGHSILKLETGIHQTEALRLYRSRGFREIDAFDQYAPDPLSVFMACDISCDFTDPKLC